MSQSIDAVIAGRRTHKTFDGSPVPIAVLRRLLELAVTAPNHRLSRPWRFTVLEPRDIAALAAWLPTRPAIAAWPDPAKGTAKLTKLLERLPQLGAMIQVTCLRHDQPDIEREDLLACGAAVQNLLLAAEARDLASFWSSGKALSHPETMRRLGADPDRERFVASVWLGGRVARPAPPPACMLDQVLRQVEWA